MLYNESMFDWFRKSLGIMHDEDGPVGYPENLIGKIFDCGRCLSLVVTLAISLIGIIVGYIEIWEGILAWLASATGVIMLERWMGVSQRRW